MGTLESMQKKTIRHYTKIGNSLYSRKYYVINSFFFKYIFLYLFLQKIIVEGILLLKKAIIILHILLYIFWSSLSLKNVYESFYFSYQGIFLAINNESKNFEQKLIFVSSFFFFTSL